MVFSSYVFLFLLLPLLILINYLIPRKYLKIKNAVLLIASLIFYAWSGTKYLALLLFSIFINWLGGVFIHQYDEKQNIKLKKIVFVIVILINVGLFGVFKYTDFMINNINMVFGSSIPLKHIVLPVGISFFTFQGMSYVIDVYMKNARYLKNPLSLALYISLFPQLVAGPIVRFDTVAEQLEDRTETLDFVVIGLQRFVFGLAKKIILADTFGMLADQAFNSTSLTTGLAWIGAFAYTLQIYFDFSGYSDMAIGLGKIFGFDFCENFNYPYISSSITEFWRRWHMSLSTWFRDYVYIPLGGNRCSKARHIFNMTVVWCLTGLWHGASWNFVLWGVYYLIWLILEKYVFKDCFSKYPLFLRRVVTFFIVIFGWILFRAENLSAAISYLQIMFGKGMSSNDITIFVNYLLNYSAFWIAGLIGMTPIAKNYAQSLCLKYKDSIAFNAMKYVFILLVLFVCVVYVIASSYNAFIYFQF